MLTEAPPDARPQTALLGVLAVCSAVGVGMVYFPQALLPYVAASLHVSPADAALVVTAPQAGYAAGPPYGSIRPWDGGPSRRS
jgi:predicted MFS family arabinose efflux permease